MPTLVVVERHIWTSTILGMLDIAFALTEDERFFTQDAVTRLLAALRIPERSTPRDIPAAIALEASSGMFSRHLSESRDAGVLRQPVARLGDPEVSLEAWRQALLNMIRTAYPDISPTESVVATKVLDDLLLALGLPERSAAFFPDEVVRAHVSGA